jgi:hypothetical protein
MKEGCPGALPARRGSPHACGNSRARGDIVSWMLPIASSSGPAFIGVVVIAAALLLWWLLRSESRDETKAKAEQEAERRVQQQATQAAERAAQQATQAAAQQAAPGAMPEPEAKEDPLSAP